MKNPIITISSKKYQFQCYTANFNSSASKIIDFGNIVFNDKSLTIRYPDYDDNKIYKLGRINKYRIQFSFTSQIEDIKGKYLFEKEGDLFYLTKINQ